MRYVVLMGILFLTGCSQATSFFDRKLNAYQDATESPCIHHKDYSDKYAIPEAINQTPNKEEPLPPGF